MSPVQLETWSSGQVDGSRLGTSENDSNGFDNICEIYERDAREQTHDF